LLLSSLSADDIENQLSDTEVDTATALVNPPELEIAFDLNSQQAIVDITEQFESQNSINDSQASVRSSAGHRRLPEIKSVASSQKKCCVCQNPQGRYRIPKRALTQVNLNCRC
jgi:hypothetical protein